jgi:nicotinamidase-related amidase
MQFPIPKSKRKKALIAVDIQHGFTKDWNKKFISNIKHLLESQKYDLYAEVSFHADKGSLWDRQTKWTFPYEPVLAEVHELFKGKKPIQIIKETRSAFKGTPKLLPALKKKGIKEVHVIGFDSNDCVFATAQEAFDLGFYTYVIEECTGASAGVTMHKHAIEMLRELGLTNQEGKI